MMGGDEGRRCGTSPPPDCPILCWDFEEADFSNLNHIAYSVRPAAILGVGTPGFSAEVRASAQTGGGWMQSAATKVIVRVLIVGTPGALSARRRAQPGKPIYNAQQKYIRPREARLAASRAQRWTLR